MSWRGPLCFLARSLYAGFFLITSIYCLLAYIPFTYQQVVVGQLLPWLTTFVRLHPYLYWGALAVVVPTLLPDWKRARSSTIAFFVGMAAAGVALLMHPVLASLENNITSIYWCLASLLPLAAIAIPDWAGRAGAVRWSEAEAGESHRLFAAAWMSALYLTFLYALALYLRARLAHSVRFSPSQWAWAVSWSLLSHLVFFMAIFIVLDLMVGLAGLLRQKRRAEFLGATLVAAALLWLVFRSLVFPPLSFRGWLADGVAAALAFSLVVFATGVSARLVRAGD
ncbi:MAG TPA: hypothetical protein VE825_18060, partial [Terriglobales bacterium]|nr:hypothetical protein [Terriglobales bacterium]